MFFPPIPRQLAGQPNLPLINHLLQLILGNTKMFLGQLRDGISQAYPGSASSGTCPKKLTEKVPRRHSWQMPKPPQLGHFDVEE